MFLQEEWTTSDLYVANCSSPYTTKCKHGDLKIWQTVKDDLEEILAAMWIQTVLTLFIRVWSFVLFWTSEKSHNLRSNHEQQGWWMWSHWGTFTWYSIYLEITVTSIVLCCEIWYSCSYNKYTKFFQVSNVVHSFIWRWFTESVLSACQDVTTPCSFQTVLVLII